MQLTLSEIAAKFALAALLLTGNLDQSAAIVRPVTDSHPSVPGSARAAGPSSLPGDSTYEVVHYRLDLTIPLVTSALSGTVTMTCRSLIANLNHVLLDMDTATVVSSTSKDSSPLTPTYNASEFKLLLPFSQPVALHDTFSLLVAYDVASVNNGFYSYQMSAYTDWAAGWFPCHDVPWDKATFDLHITVPKGVEVASIGLLVDRVLSKDGLRETFNWRTDNPAATHLVGMMMSRYYSRWSDWYVPSAADSIEIAYYIFQRDSIPATQDFLHIVAAMDFFATMFGPYPFEKYGMAETEPLYYGAMEYQTMSMISSKWIRGNLTAEDGFVHELAHQWWGDAVGFTDWYSMWLSEGFAEYSAALFAEHQYGQDTFRESMERKKNSYAQQAALKDYSIANPTFDYSHIPIVYKKGAWVLHMLRHVVGTERFWLILQEYFNLYKYSNVTIPQFQAIAEGVYGEDLGWFFTQWIYNLGYPIISATHLTTEVAPGDFQCAVTLKQIQDAGPVFTMPLDLRFTAGGGQLDTTVWLNSSSQTFVFALPFSPHVLEIDPLGKVLMETGNVTPYDDQARDIIEEFSLSQNYPNPFNPNTTIRYQIPRRSHVTLSVFNVLGQRVTTLVDEAQEAGHNAIEFDASALPSSLYLYRLQAGSFVQTKKMVVMQ